METENRKDRVIRIIKTIMFNYGYDSVQKFADDIGANYMQVYYCYIGKTTAISKDLCEKIKTKFPDINEDFVMTGYGNIKGGESEPVPYGERASDEVTPADMFRLLERVTTLLEKLQKREDALIERMEELKSREKELDEKLQSVNQNLNVCG